MKISHYRGELNLFTPALMALWSLKLFIIFAAWENIALLLKIIGLTAYTCVGACLKYTVMLWLWFKELKGLRKEKRFSMLWSEKGW